ncbi:DsrE family protein [Marinobacter sp.]|uniref:DsrE family protein n=1 Tax=Marinobacter sp. TaxID=50741 RepID=UPI00384AF095
MRILVIIDKAPYGDWRGREALDMAFSLAAFDQPVSILFREAGVNWLRPGHHSEPLGQKNVEKQLGAAGIFGVEALLAEQKALERYQLDEACLNAAAQAVAPDAAFFDQYDHVVCL